MKQFLKRILKLLGLGFLSLIVVLGIGRLIQINIDSNYHGARGPYLQMPAPDAMTLRWQSEDSYRGLVGLGASAGSLTSTASEKQADDVHELRMENLQPLTRYFYRAGSEAKPVYQGNDYWFVTPPKTGESVPVRFWVIGDPGKTGKQQQQVRDAMLKWLDDNPRDGRAYLDFFLTTGDNAYRSGTNQQFQDAFFTPYQNILRNIPVWPAYGNHDARRWAFFKIFTFPEKGESGGVASGSEHYYSFDYGNIHFVFLDSEDSDRADDSKMAKWLKQDLAANQLEWTIAVFHHPPYSKGSHDSDNDKDSGGRLHDMRQNFVPILEQFDVDLVLTGHSHGYERSHFMTCHYGHSSTLKDEMILDKDRSFNKPMQKQANQGTVYAVVGSSSKADNAALNHPAMDVSRKETGSMLIDVNATELVARFINGKGQVTDRFSIQKIKDMKPVTDKAACH